MNPPGITVNPTGQFVYAADYQTGDIAGFSIDCTTGALTPIPGSPFPSASEVIDVAVDPTGQFACAAGQRGTLSAYPKRQANTNFARCDTAYYITP